MIIIVATFGQAVAGEAHAVNVLGVIVVWRGLIGIGIGGVGERRYPALGPVSRDRAVGPPGGGRGRPRARARRPRS